MFESSTAFMKATQIKRDESYHQKPLQIICQKIMRFKAFHKFLSKNHEV